MAASSKQTLVVVRHGERLDNVDYSWVHKARRPYDPPITEVGTTQAKCVGKAIKDLKLDMETVISSPFIRCLQTAQQICDGLDLPGMTTCNGIVDVLSSHCGIHEQPIVPADNVAELGIKVLNCDQTPLPKYPEKTKAGLKRFRSAFNSLADQYWPNDIVIVSHGYGVCQAVAMTMGQEYFQNVWVDYCGFMEMSRTAKSSYDWTRESIYNIHEY